VTKDRIEVLWWLGIAKRTAGHCGGVQAGRITAGGTQQDLQPDDRP
jgi:hypothetical protein